MSSKYLVVQNSNDSYVWAIQLSDVFLERINSRRSMASMAYTLHEEEFEEIWFDESCGVYHLRLDDGVLDDDRQTDLEDNYSTVMTASELGINNCDTSEASCVVDESGFSWEMEDEKSYMITWERLQDLELAAVKA